MSRSTISTFKLFEMYPDEASEARVILERHGATNIHVHPVASAAGETPAGPSVH